MADMTKIDEKMEVLTNIRKSIKRDAIKAERSHLVVQANKFIRVPHLPLTARELNLVWYFISKVKPEDKDFYDMTISIETFCGVCGLEYDGRTLMQLKKILFNLGTKGCWYEEQNGEQVLIRWLDKVRIVPQSDDVVVRLSDTIKPYLLELIKTGKYTQSEFQYYAAMKSKYSKRLYEIVKSYMISKQDKTFSHAFEIDELKKMLNAEDYTRHPDFRRFVVGISIDEINENTDIKMSCTWIKTGRSFTHVTFVFARKSYDELNATQLKLAKKFKLFDKKYNEKLSK